MKFNKKLIAEVREGKAAINNVENYPYGTFKDIINEINPDFNIDCDWDYFYIVNNTWCAANYTNFRTIPLHDFIFEEKEEDV